MRQLNQAHWVFSRFRHLVKTLYNSIQLIFDIARLTKVAPSSEVPHALAAQKQLYCRAIVREGLAQGPYADGLRWIRTCNPPVARHRTYPYTNAPHYVGCCSKVHRSTGYLRNTNGQR